MRAILTTGGVGTSKTDRTPFVGFDGRLPGHSLTCVILDMRGEGTDRTVRTREGAQ
jgi:hypothetical protein